MRCAYRPSERESGRRRAAVGCAFVVGAVFTVSGLAKSLDTSRFAETIVRYGFDTLRFSAPLVILTELAVGLSLVSGIRLRRTAAVGTVLTLVLTLAYLYGHLYRNVDDCGCFGPIEALNTASVGGMALRNSLLMAGLLWVTVFGDDGRPHDMWLWSLLAVVMAAAAFMCGYTMRRAAAPEPELRFRAEPLRGTPLGETFVASPDSTYLVFAFSYNCPHCLNSIANLNRYRSAGVADRVVAFALADEAAARRFRTEFDPAFEIRDCTPPVLFGLTDRLPTTWYISGDTIRWRWTGELPAACLLREAFDAADVRGAGRRMTREE